MNKRIIAILSAIVLVAAFVTVLRQRVLSSSPTSSETIGRAAPAQAVVRLQGSALGQQSASRSPRSQKPEDLLDRHNAGAAGFDSKVQFWGKVLDQDGHPIEGASIRASVTTLRLIKTEKGYREFELLYARSKADGTFMLDGAAGFSLTIEKLTKPGYVLPAPYQEAMRFPEDFKHRYTYNPMGGPEKPFHPDPASPVIFRLWKLRNPEPLLLRGTWAGYRGPEYQLDGEATTDVRRTVLVAVASVGTKQSPLWEVTVTAAEADGGIAKANPSDTFMFEAPEGGYERVQKFRYSPSEASQYEQGLPVRFFVRSKHGRWYAAVDSIFFAPDDSGQILTKSRYWLNPNGSRNLEHDAANPLPEPSL